MHDVAGSTSKLSCIGELTGKLSTTNVARSTGKLSSIGELNGKLSTDNVQNEYAGPYEVTSDLFEDTTLKTLEALQTNSGYYTYRTTKLQKYIINGKETAVYVSPREVVSSSDTNTYSNKTYEYTHGFGAIISQATKVSENGNVIHSQKDFEKSDEIINISDIIFI